MHTQMVPPDWGPDKARIALWSIVGLSFLVGFVVFLVG